MTVQFKILAACLVFVGIIAMVGGLAQQQAAQMGRLAIGIYDHAFMGMSYVDQAQGAFLRLEATHLDADATLSDSEDLRKVLLLMDVALDRASTQRAREAGKQTRALLAALSDAPGSELTERMTQADRALTKLVKKFAADGLDARDNAEELATNSTRLVLIEIAVAVCLALGVGWLVGRNLSRPLVSLVGAIDQLAAGELDREIPATLARRRDEIGAVARAAAVFRQAMHQNAKADDEREQVRENNELEKIEVLRQAADSIERETTHVAESSARSGAALAARANDLAGSAARMLANVDLATAAGNAAMSSCEIVAAAGEELSASSREIASQIMISATEIANTARAGDNASKIIDELSDSMRKVSTVAHLIGDIAGRTNLLALNATIEAARAGDAGRGFAVVANEVKTLAMQTARSTGEIASTVRAVQLATQDAVKAVGDMVGRMIAIECSTQAIASAAEQQTAATGEIARSVLGTVEAMRVVTAQMSAVTQEAHSTEAAVGEMQWVAGTVSDQIAELRSVMVRIVRTSSDAANRRNDDRVPVNLPGTLLVNGSAVGVMCLNISHCGARIRGDKVLQADMSVVLRLPDLPDIEAKTMQAGTEVGLRFDWQAGAVPPELNEWLDRKAAA